MRKVAICVLTLLLTLSCERRTEVKLEGGNPPNFVLSGSGRLGEVLIFGPEQEPIAKSEPSDKTFVLWEIETEKQVEGGSALVEKVGTITYGIVPRGYKQVKPKEGFAAGLVSGKRYRYWFVTVNAPHAAGYFEIRDGKPISVPGP